MQYSIIFWAQGFSPVFLFPLFCPSFVLSAPPSSCFLSSPLCACHLHSSSLYLTSLICYVFLPLGIILFLYFISFFSVIHPPLLLLSFCFFLLIFFSAWYFFSSYSSSGRSASTSLNTREKIERCPEERLNVSAHIYTQSQLSGGISLQTF